VFDIFCQKMSGNDSREFKKRGQLIIGAHDETVSVTAMPDSGMFMLPSPRDSAQLSTWVEV